MAENDDADGRSLWDTLRQHSEIFSDLISYLENARPGTKAYGLMLRLSGERRGGPYTFFAPSNTAIRRFVRAKKMTMNIFRQDASFGDLLLGHTIEGDWPLSALRLADTLETLSGPSTALAFRRKQSGRLFVQAAGGWSAAKVDLGPSLPSDLRCRNGILHAVDRVLEPQTTWVSTVDTPTDIYRRRLENQSQVRGVERPALTAARSASQPGRPPARRIDSLGPRQTRPRPASKDRPQSRKQRAVQEPLPPPPRLPRPTERELWEPPQPTCGSAAALLGHRLDMSPTRETVCHTVAQLQREMDGLKLELGHCSRKRAIIEEKIREYTEICQDVHKLKAVKHEGRPQTAYVKARVESPAELQQLFGSLSNNFFLIMPVLLSTSLIPIGSCLVLKDDFAHVKTKADLSILKTPIAASFELPGRTPAFRTMHSNCISPLAESSFLTNFEAVLLTSHFSKAVRRAVKATESRTAAAVAAQVAPGTESSQTQAATTAAAAAAAAAAKATTAAASLPAPSAGEAAKAAEATAAVAKAKASEVAAAATSSADASPSDAASATPKAATIATTTTPQAKAAEAAVTTTTTTSAAASKSPPTASPKASPPAQASTSTTPEEAAAAAAKATATGTAATAPTTTIITPTAASMTAATVAAPPPKQGLTERIRQAIRKAKISSKQDPESTTRNGLELILRELCAGSDICWGEEELTTIAQYLFHALVSPPKQEATELSQTATFGGTLASTSQTTALQQTRGAEKKSTLASRLSALLRSKRGPLEQLGLSELSNQQGDLQHLLLHTRLLKKQLQGSGLGSLAALERKLQDGKETLKELKGRHDFIEAQRERQWQAPEELWRSALGKSAAAGQPPTTLQDQIKMAEKALFEAQLRYARRQDEQQLEQEASRNRLQGLLHEAANDDASAATIELENRLLESEIERLRARQKEAARAKVQGDVTDSYLRSLWLEDKKRRCRTILEVQKAKIIQKHYRKYRNDLQRKIRFAVLMQLAFRRWHRRRQRAAGKIQKIFRTWRSKGYPGSHVSAAHRRAAVEQPRQSLHRQRARFLE